MEDDKRNRIDLGAELGGITDDLLKDIHAAAQEESVRQAKAKLPEKSGIMQAFEKNKNAYLISFIVVAFIIAAIVFIGMARNSGDKILGDNPRPNPNTVQKSAVSSPIARPAVPINAQPTAPQQNMVPQQPVQGDDQDNGGDM
jgi:hypothetical protein